MKWIINLLWLLGLASLISMSYATSHSQKPLVCDNTYALCNAASCQKIPGIKDKVLCKCSVWTGKNVGFSACKARVLQKTKNGDKKLLSTFAFGGNHYRYQTCPGNSTWASCLDQPCLIDKQSIDGRQAFCTCNIKHTQKPFVTFAGFCDKTFCNKTLWSGATIEGNKKLIHILAKAMGQAELAKRSECQRR